MMRLRAVCILSLLGWGAIALAQGITPALRIVSPKSGEKTTNTYITAQYELSTQVSAAASPTFRLQLDGQEPVDTTDTQYTFTGLTPGAHVVQITAIDANGTPISGTQATVQFRVVQEIPAPGPKSPGAEIRNPGRMVNAAYQATSDAGEKPQPSAGAQQPAISSGDTSPAGQQKLPSSGSELPLLSVIGMGVLVGGIVSALRTRPSNSR